jgi:tRNA1(Val) A37 N6-methylase TrmN6
MTQPDGVTLDKILGGQVALEQAANGYRAGMDAILLAACLTAEPGQKLIEFGCGPGAVMLCAAHRIPECSFTGLDIDPEAVSLAERNISMNRQQDRVAVVAADLAAPLPASILSIKPEQIFFNPPYFDDPNSLRLPKIEKRRAWLSGDAPLKHWIHTAAQLIAPRGRLTLIHRADALPDIMASLTDVFGSIVIKPVQPRAGQAAKRVIVTARKAGRSPLRLLAPLIMHDDSQSAHTSEANAVLRGQAVIDLR